MEKEKIKTYQDLIVWQRSRELVVLVYRLTDAFPGAELFGLTSQIRRAVISIPSNVAEGFRRKSVKEKIQFLRIAYGSGSELETQLILSTDLGFLEKDDLVRVDNLLHEVMSMLNKIIANFEKRS